MVARLGRNLSRRGPARGAGFVSDEAPMIILGMHRSGTSLVSRLLERAGMYVGGSWVDENHEAYHFLRANRAMIGEGYYALYDYGWTAPKTDEFIAARRGYAERAASHSGAFFAERTNERVWGWKDPRNSLTLPVWLSIYPAARAIHVLRDGRAVALSLADRDSLDLAFGIDLWAHYTMRADRALAALPDDRKLTVRYEDLLASPDTVLPGVLSFAGLDAPADLGSLIGGIDTTRVEARLSDPRLAEIADHPMLARYGYTQSAG